MTIIFSTLNGILFGIENLLIIWIGVSSIIDGVFTVGVFVAFMSYKEQFKGKANSLIDNFIKYKLLDIDKERISDIILADSDGNQNKKMFDISTISENDVQLKNLSFRYSENDRLIINNININLIRFLSL